VEKGLPGFVTAFLGFLDPETGWFTYSSAGHPAPLLAADGQIAFLESISSPLGVFAGARYRDSEILIRQGSVLLFYTDGITEARSDGEIFGEERLADAVAQMDGRPVESIPTSLLDEALEFSGGVLRDDAALLAVNFLGKTGRGQPGAGERA
jgi:sigma-B regulation protein RsbU (phosphoserine phosphatase)